MCTSVQIPSIYHRPPASGPFNTEVFQITQFIEMLDAYLLFANKNLKFTIPSRTEPSRAEPTQWSLGFYSPNNSVWYQHFLLYKIFFFFFLQILITNRLYGLDNYYLYDSNLKSYYVFLRMADLKDGFNIHIIFNLIFFFAVWSNRNYLSC